MSDGKWVSKANLQTFWQSIRSKVLPNMVGDTVTSWLNEHVTPTGSAVVVDDTLTIQGAAADAKKTGDEISGLKKDLNGLAADAKKTGDEISGLKKDLNGLAADAKKTGDEISGLKKDLNDLGLSVVDGAINITYQEVSE